MEIHNPRRILAIGAPNSGVLDLLKDLTGSAPTPLENTTAGLSHTLQITTPYYAASIPIWIDEFASPASWHAEFSTPEAAEVITALGAWIFCFRRPLPDAPANSPANIEVVKATMRAVQQVVGDACGHGWDGVCLAVAMPQSTVPYLEMEGEEWEELCREYGFEYVNGEAKGKNEFGETIGTERVKEALEANEWEGEDAELDNLLEEHGEGFEGSFEAEEAEMNMELFGMKGALHGEEGAAGNDDKDEALHVEELEKMMAKMQAVKDMSAGLPEEQRKKLAAKAVNEIMKSM